MTKANSVSVHVLLVNKTTEAAL